MKLRIIWQDDGPSFERAFHEATLPVPTSHLRLRRLRPPPDWRKPVVYLVTTSWRSPGDGQILTTFAVR